MPPKPAKGADKGPSKKTEAKKKEKVVEDKTFGLKNKKGSKQQKFIQHVTKQVQFGNKSGREIEKLQQEKLSKKDQKKKEQDELQALFRPVQDQKIGKGVNPKSVLCAFFKQGLCTKGEKCKFSHDLTIQRKAEKRSLYDDEEGGEKKDSMDNWDEAKLEEVVNQKHGEQNKSLPKTTIICKYFLDAVEESKYGWFWTCPNGDKCHYKHALPPGFVLKKDKKRMDEQKEEAISLEELIEKERAALSSKNLTKVTLESFLKWKERKRKEKISKAQAESDKKKLDYKAGKTVGISGRLMFEFNPDLAEGDDADASADTYLQPDEDDEIEDGVVREISLDQLTQEAREVDNSGTVSVSAERRGDPTASIPDPNTATVNGESEESDKLEMAAALPPEQTDAAAATNAAIAAAMAATVDGDIADAAIDENLFDGDDLDLVDEELETLDLVD